MISIKVQTNEDGFMTIHAEGHAKSEICASVSTILQSNVRFLQELSTQYPNELQIKINGGQQ